MRSTREFGIRDKIGYFLGDLANGATFQLASIYLMKFYTDVLFINPKLVGAVFLFSRVLDAFTDVGMGRITDISKPTKDGKFKPWIKRVAVFVALASFLMYQSKMANQPDMIKNIYMIVTYLFWGSICYTAINIPYGSMASVMTNVPSERTELSSFRAFGGIGAGVILGMIIPSIVYKKVEVGGKIISVLDGPMFTMVAGVTSIVAFLAYMGCYYLCTERIEYVEKKDEKKVSFGEALSSIVKNRSLLALILSSIVLLLAQIATNSMSLYLYQDYFNDTHNMRWIQLVNAIPLFIVMPIAGKLTTKYGRKEAGVVSLTITGVLYLLLLIFKVPANATGGLIFLGASFIANLALGYFNLVTWAYVMDVIDDQEVKTGNRDDGTVYALYSFSRKLGQSFAGLVSGLALGVAGFSTELAKQGLPQTVETANSIFKYSVGIPGVFYIVVALILLIAYPLGKEKVEENNRILAERRKQN